MACLGERNGPYLARCAACTYSTVQQHSRWRRTDDAMQRKRKPASQPASKRASEIGRRALTFSLSDPHGVHNRKTTREKKKRVIRSVPSRMDEAMPRSGAVHTVPYPTLPYPTVHTHGRRRGRPQGDKTCSTMPRFHGSRVCGFAVPRLHGSTGPYNGRMGDVLLVLYSTQYST